MSEDAAVDTDTSETQGGNSTTSGDTPAANEFKPITSQQELNAALKDRSDRERAKFKDYNDIKVKAAKLDEIEQANLTELEKANGRISTAESDRDTAKAEALRLRIAVTHGISLEDADLFLIGTTEERLTAQAKRLSARAAEQANAEADRKKKNPIVSKQGQPVRRRTCRRHPLDHRDRSRPKRNPRLRIGPGLRRQGRRRVDKAHRPGRHDATDPEPPAIPGDLERADIPRPGPARTALDLRHRPSGGVHGRPRKQAASRRPTSRRGCIPGSCERVCCLSGSVPSG